MNRFRHQTAIITGAASGIGYTIVDQLLSEGANVVFNDIDTELAQAALGEFRRKYEERVSAVIGDASSIQVIQSLVDCAVERYGNLDMAIAHAGTTTFGNFFDFPRERMQQMLDLNLQGTFYLVQRAARQMRDQGKGGSVLLTSSVIGMRAYPQLTAYAMTKAAISMMARSLVTELSPYQININAIAPGATLTPRTAEEIPQYADFWQSVIPMARIADPDDVAGPALFLLSGAARQITGQTLIVDGGWTSVGADPKQIINKEKSNMT